MTILGSHDPMHVLIVLEDFRGAFENTKSISLFRIKMTDFTLSRQNSVDDDILLFIAKRFTVVDH